MLQEKCLDRNPEKVKTERIDTLTVTYHYDLTL